MIAAAIFPVSYFLFLKLNLFPALHLFSLCSVLPFVPSSADWALLDCAIDRRVRDIIFEAILSLSKRYPFRIILKIFAVNYVVAEHLRMVSFKK